MQEGEGGCFAFCLVSQLAHSRSLPQKFRDTTDREWMEGSKVRLATCTLSFIFHLTPPVSPPGRH